MSGQNSPRKKVPDKLVLNCKIVPDKTVPDKILQILTQRINERKLIRQLSYKPNQILKVLKLNAELVVKLNDRF